MRSATAKSFHLAAIVGFLRGILAVAIKSSLSHAQEGDDRSNSVFRLGGMIGVGQNGSWHDCRGTDRQSGRNLGVARLVASTWQVGVAKRGKGRE